MTKATQIGVWVRRYDKEIFPLYSSFKGGADGRMVNADSRENVWMNRWLWIKIGGALVVGVVSIIKVWYFFHPAEGLRTAKEEPAKAGQEAGASAGYSSPRVPPFSSDWRVAGILVVGGRGQVLMVDGAGRIRAESPSLFQLDGIARIGQVDGQRVTTFSGAAVKTVSAAPAAGIAPMAPSPASSGGVASVPAAFPSPIGGTKP